LLNHRNVGADAVVFAKNVHQKNAGTPRLLQGMTFIIEPATSFWGLN